jgi:hypothetical protein
MIILIKLMTVARFNILTGVKMSVSIFWAVTPCDIVGRYQYTIGTYCLHLPQS